MGWFAALVLVIAAWWSVCTSATAHNLTTPTMTVGETTDLLFSIRAEEQQPLTELRFDLPDRFNFTGANVAPPWVITSVGEELVIIGGQVAPGHFLQFTITGSYPTAGALYLPYHARYADDTERFHNSRQTTGALPAALVYVNAPAPPESAGAAFDTSSHDSSKVGIFILFGGVLGIAAFGRFIWPRLSRWLNG